ncbi:lipocalin-like domain-containing protein [Ichthyenterobacterium magnum]|uniref:Putative secreted protein (Por secretion system target) n=1 Tax=Ichthyenterobacterium magnum TaxID=1230530 RepID=A0A420DLB6_9FLAO|nr:lipocalin-like domain-containing protein [Ichthyenterobacterium magnum]RKE95033.1 putative secreted protein (Por secretion system target) [Ichthyenterobacterium magnum]
MKLKTNLLLVFIICVASFTYAQDWKVYPYEPSGQVAFPVDEGRHTSEPIEWWYSAGHVVGQNSGKNYSFMYTFFHYPQFGYDGFRILNITDDDTGTFYQDVKPVTYTTLSTTDFNIEATVLLGGTEYWRNKVDGMLVPIPFEYELSAASATEGLDLEFVTLKRPLILGDDGYLDQGLANYTYYYSQTKNDVTGNITVAGVSEPVIGTGWIDRQYGDFNPLTGEKYEWFSMQLSNGMDINLWNIFTATRQIPDTEKYKILSAYVDESTQYTSSDFEIERLAFNCMPDDMMCYSKQWRLTSTTNNLDLIISTQHDNTEVQLPFRFFEGATTITGTVNGNPVTGIGFAELLHDYQNPEVTITSPNGGVYDTAMPISWTLTNPDDGRPVFYDLEYSVDNQANFLPVVQGLTDTFYLWTNPTLLTGDDVWFKVIAYSIDGTLTNTIISPTSSSAFITLSTQNIEENKIQLYPNPVDDILTLEFNTNLNDVVYEIIDLNGRLIFKSKKLSTSNIEIKAEHLTSGLYYIKVHHDVIETVLKFIKK